MEAENPWLNAQRQFDNAAAILDLSPGLREVLRDVRRELMAWIMDTISMEAGYSVPAVVTGKPLDIGGSEGRPTATGRGVTIVAIEACRRLGTDPHGTTVAVQGFGNVGSVSAHLMAKA